MLLVIFLLAGGIGSYVVFTQGASTVMEARFALTGVFFFGFLFAGFLGLLYAINNRESRRCLLGFVVVLFCYGSIELIGWIVNSFVPLGVYP